MSKPLRLVEMRPTGPERARGLVSSRASGSRVDARFFAPPVELQDVIERFWEARWDLRGQPCHESKNLSDPCVHVVFEHGQAARDARVVGVWTRMWRRRLEERGHVLGAKVRAGAVQAFFDRPAHELSNRICSLDELVPWTSTTLTASVLDPPESARAHAFGALAAFMTRLRRPDDPRVAQVIELVEAAVAHPEITSAHRLAEHAGLTVRALQRLFRQHVGATPKWVIRRNRLQEAAQRIQAGDGSALADVAFSLGYTDQAHLTRDFRAATGITPGRLLAHVR
ncbi:MAG: helix-turn-helix transcriptional regulator [Myxococcales bacterium]|nr:helix-turn-helix transcriptional regulator [Myxococcales bacterium]